MSWTGDIRTAVSAWRKHAEGLRTLRRIAEQRPATAAFAFDLVAEELQQRAILDLYYFGVVSPQARYTRHLERTCDQETEAVKESLFYETYFHEPDRYKELAARGVFDQPRDKEDLLRKGPSLSFDEELGAALAAVQLKTYQVASRLMDIAGESSRAAGNGFYGPAMCDVFLEASEQLPLIFAGRLQEKWGGDPKTRHRALASLTGWVVTKTSLHKNPRLKAALSGVRGSSAFNQFLQGIGAATAIEWASLERGDSLSDLVSRARLRLEHEGDEATELNRTDKLAALDGGSFRVGVDERDALDFARRETLAKEVEGKGLSDQELESFFYGTLFGNAEAARLLGRSQVQLRQEKYRASKKLKATS